MAVMAKKATRGANGRFLPGNPGGPGNPHVQQTAQLRATLLRSVTPADMESVAKKLVAMAKGGDLDAIRELLDRVLGKPAASLTLAGDLSVAHPSHEERHRLLLNDRTRELICEVATCLESGRGLDSTIRDARSAGPDGDAGDGRRVADGQASGPDQPQAG